MKFEVNVLKLKFDDIAKLSTKSKLGAELVLFQSNQATHPSTHPTLSVGPNDIFKPSPNPPLPLFKSNLFKPSLSPV